MVVRSVLDGRDRPSGKAPAHNTHPMSIQGNITPTSQPRQDDVDAVTSQNDAEPSHHAMKLQHPPPLLMRTLLFM